jgi:hypothetical protein
VIHISTMSWKFSLGLVVLLVIACTSDLDGVGTTESESVSTSLPVSTSTLVPVSTSTPEPEDTPTSDPNATSNGFSRALELLPNSPEIREAIWISDKALQRTQFGVELPGRGASDEEVTDYLSELATDDKVEGGIPISRGSTIDSLVSGFGPGGARSRTGELLLASWRLTLT